LRILHLIHTLNPSHGGPVEAIKQMSAGLEQHAVSVDVLSCTDRAGDSWVADFPLHVHALGPGRLGRFGYTPRLRPWLVEYGREYDAWVINGLWQFQSLGAASVARRLGVPYYVYAHGMLDPRGRRAHPLKHLKKVLYWILFEQRALRQAEAVCFTSTEEARLALSCFPFGSWNPFVAGAGILSPPVPKQEAVAAFMQRFPALREKRIWMFLGRIHPVKGLDLLVEAFRELGAEAKDVHLLVAGPGDNDYVAAMHRLVVEAGLASRVTFTGPLYGEDKWVSFKASELFVLPSHQENFSMAVAEALAMGVAVCISDKINIWREISEARAGVVCADDVPSLVAALRSWNGLPDEARRKFSKRAVECFGAYFRAERIALRFFERISADKAARHGSG
jgi:glycosyltransferase involved in cell wall biosynthesis